MAAAVIGATMPCAAVFTHLVYAPSPPFQCARAAQPSIPSVDRVAVSSGLPPFPSRHVRSSKHPIHHHTGEGVVETIGSRQSEERREKGGDEREWGGDNNRTVDKGEMDTSSL